MPSRRQAGLRLAFTVVVTTTVAAGLGPAASQNGCHPSYRGACIPPNAPDVDCYGGTGNGPYYVGRVVVIGPDVFRLDADGDGLGCEDSPTVLPGGSILASG